MKKLSVLITIFFLVAIFVMPAHSGIKKVAQTGLQFLKLDYSPRAAAMGGAYMLVGTEADAMFYNPSGMAKMRSSVDVFFGNTQWIADIKYNAGAIAKSLGQWGTVGFNIIYADYGSDIQGTRVASNEQGYVETGNVDVGAYSAGIAYAKRLSDKFSVGGGIRYVGQKLGENLMPDGSTKKNNVNGLAFDFGTMFYPGLRSLRFGMSVRNFSKEFKYEKEGFQLPLTFSIGMAMNVLDFMEDENQTLLVSVDAIHPRDYSERLNFGAEYILFNMLALRGGYKTNYDIEGLTGGFGVFYKMSGIAVRFDYSYSAIEVFDAINRFSVGLSF